ncbi:MAG: phosphatidate cytidylyltransferase [Gammaproteobacteria bacterium]|nr:phosphatidate cytidylyltransferase [Gammaproteobacteria bacterium]
MVKRLATAIIAIVAVVLGLGYLPHWLLHQWVVLVIFTVLVSEWLSLSGWRRFSNTEKTIWGLVAVVTGVCIAFIFGDRTQSVPQYVFQWLIAIDWLVCFLAVLLIRPDRLRVLIPSSWLCIFGILLIGGSLHSIAYLFLNTSLTTFIGLLAIIWLIDSGAFFVGKLIGKTPFFNHISPNKTLEGFIGGCVFGIVASIVLLAIDDSFLRLTTIWYMVPIMIVCAVLGDLFFSAMKRVAKVKDTSNLLPGHGGVLDRFDSILPTTAILSLMPMPGLT